MTKMPTVRKAASDQRFSRDGQHQAVLVFRGVDVTGAKQDGKGARAMAARKGRLAETNDFVHSSGVASCR